jgi:hypothetical protein
MKSSYAFMSGICGRDSPIFNANFVFTCFHRCGLSVRTACVKDFNLLDHFQKACLQPCGAHIKFALSVCMHNEIQEIMNGFS